MVTAGSPYHAPLAEMDFEEARRALPEHPMVMLEVARYAAGKVRAEGTLLFMSGTGARHPAVGVGIASALTAPSPALTASLALEVAPVRVNLTAAGFVDTPLSASLLGTRLEECIARTPSARRSERKASLLTRSCDHSPIEMDVQGSR
jgi:NAD(P)-dependent dehydrogenase (short-subunit alcohol dehydrogenase family)